jgi:uncharacterized protein YgiB involved in biofilm formation
LKNNRTKAVTLILAGMVGSGCDYDPAKEPVQRDVYSKIEDCMADWGDSRLCTEAAQNQQQQQYAGTQPHPVFIRPYYFHGPEYIPGDRATYYDGRRVAPRSNLAPIHTTPSMPSAAFVSARAATPGGVSRGIFGGSGRAAGGIGA